MKIVRFTFTFLAALSFLIAFSDLGHPSPQEPNKNLIKKRKIQEMYRTYKNESFKNVPDISVDSLLSLRKKGEKYIIVDVRENKEIEVSVIPFSITKKEFEKNFNKYKEHKIIIYCTIGYRSGIYTRKLIEKKLDALNLIGGVLEWAHAYQKFASAGGDSQIVHVYGKKWDLAPEGYQSVW